MLLRLDDGFSDSGLRSGRASDSGCEAAACGSATSSLSSDSIAACYRVQLRKEIIFLSYCVCGIWLERFFSGQPLL